MHVQIHHSLAHLQDLISTLAGVITYIIYYLILGKVGIKSCRCAAGHGLYVFDYNS